jgi:hypothetical protein
MNIHQQPNRRGSDVRLYDAANAGECVKSFKLYRKRMRREVMLWNPFVTRITRELQRFGEAYEAGLRPKMAFVTPPQFGKSMAAEDVAAWLGGRNPNRRILYASYSESLGMRMSLNLQRMMISTKYREVFPYMDVGRPGWTMNTSSQASMAPSVPPRSTARSPALVSTSAFSMTS